MNFTRLSVSESVTLMCDGSARDWLAGDTDTPLTRYNRLYNTGLTTGWMFVYTIQPVVTQVVKRV